jgi:hypothetical protein
MDPAPNPSRKSGRPPLYLKVITNSGRRLTLAVVWLLWNCCTTLTVLSSAS